MFDVSLAWANFWYDAFNVILFVGAFAVAVGTYGSIKMGAIRDKFSDVRTTALETQTEQAKAELALAHADIAKANVKISEANARAAEANRKAEQERLERLKTEARLAWRFLSPEQKERITNRMKEYLGQKFTVVTYRLDDPEASNLGALIQQALENAGWKYELSKPLDWLDTGVSVEAVTGGWAAHNLVESLNAEGVVTKQVMSEKYSAYPEMLFVVVGKKPPSPLEIPELDGR